MRTSPGASVVVEHYKKKKKINRKYREKSRTDSVVRVLLIQTSIGESDGTSDERGVFLELMTSIMATKES